MSTKGQGTCESHPGPLNRPTGHLIFLNESGVTLFEVSQEFLQTNIS